MSKESVFCIAASLGQANRIVDQLKFWKFSNNDISVVFSDKGRSHELVHKKKNKASQAAIIARVFGGALGRTAGMGAQTNRGVDPTIDAGPMMVELSETAVDEPIGGVGGGLIGMDIPESEAKGYEIKIKAGNLLISVHAGNAHEIALAKDIFTQSGAEDIRTTSQASTLRETRSRRQSRNNRVMQNTGLQKVKSFLWLG